MSAKGGPIFTFSLTGGAARTLLPRQLYHCRTHAESCLLKTSDVNKPHFGINLNLNQL